MKKRGDFLVDWYETQSHIYNKLRKLVEKLIKKRLIEEGYLKNHEYVLVDSRLKTAESFLTKMERKKYSDPTEMTDIAGIRVVACILSDIRNFAHWLRPTFA